MANSLLYEGASSPASRNAYFHQSLALAAMCFALTSNSLINSQRGTPIAEAVLYADGTGQWPSESAGLQGLERKGAADRESAAALNEDTYGTVMLDTASVAPSFWSTAWTAILCLPDGNEMEVRI